MTLAWLGLCAGVLLLAQPVAADEHADAVARGEQIYLHGRLANGSALQGRRGGGQAQSSGEAAACVNCHKHSAMGAREGIERIPPIAGRYLDPPYTLSPDKPDVMYVENMHGRRSPYKSDTMITRAIREGIDPDGHVFSPLMPRYALSDEDAADIIAYLKSLDRPVQPGVTDRVLSFATIVTPDAEPARRDAVLAVLNQFVHDKNDKAFTIGPTGPVYMAGRSFAGKMMHIVPRRWDLQVWTLTGAPDTWQAQLEQDYAAHPVLAVLSGVGGLEWTPVHRFCEGRKVPCLFPNIDFPVDQQDDFYPLYFTRGLALEADLIASGLNAPGHEATEVVQVYRRASAGELAARQLTLTLKGEGRAIEDIALPPDADAAAIQAALARPRKPGPLVLWLPSSDIANLGDIPGWVSAAFLSGRLGRYDDMPLPSAWRPRAEIAYPIDLPEQRHVRLHYTRDWMQARHLPITEITLQTDTWLACSILAETINEMVDAFVPEYLVERIQEALDHRFVAGNFPRLSLTDHQRFASKGGYLVRFTQPTGPALTPVGGWLVP